MLRVHVVDMDTGSCQLVLRLFHTFSMSSTAVVSLSTFADTVSPAFQALGPPAYY